MMGKIKRYISVALCCVGLLSTATSSAGPPNGEFRTGRLANGLTYYVRHTKVQPGQAGFYLVQNVGSLMEEDSQRGLAHFLEHMAFNASQNFPGQVDRFLQKNNLTRYNAYTDFDQTVYNIDNVPTANAELVDSCLLVLHDWCDGLTFPDKGIAKERGIILEEWRTRRDAVSRAREQIVSKLYNGSRYASREVIGDVNVLETFERNELVDYYNRWYRPDLQAVVIAGDIDVERVERFIVDRFSTIVMPADAEPRPGFTIDERVEPQYVRVVDKELGPPAMEFTQRIAKQPAAETDRELIRRITIRQLYNNMIAARLAKISGGDESAIHGAAISYDELVRGYDGNTISINPYPERDFRAVYQVLGVFETVKKLGFTQYEFEQQSRQMIRQAEGFERNLDRIGYEVFITLYQNHYLYTTPIVEPARRTQLTREILNELTADDVNKWVNSWAASDADRVFIVSGNDENYEYITLDDIIAAEQDVRESELVQPSFGADTARLIDFELTPATVVKEQTLPIGEALQWTLSNGATVCFKAADEGSGKFRMSATSKGGLSLIKDGDIPSAKAVGSLAFASGVYNTDRSAMIELIQNRDMEITFGLQSLGETINGKALSSEADQFFELLHLGITHPRFDETEFARYVNELKISLDTHRPTEMDAVADTVDMLFTKRTLRNAKVDSAYIAGLDLERVRAIFDERFRNPSDFTYFIVGDMSAEDAKELSCKYIGSIKPLTKTQKKEKYILHPTSNRSEPFVKEFRIDMPDNRAVVDISFSNNMKMDRRQSTAFWLMGVILNSRCTDEIRERLGGSYNVEVSTRYNELADPREWLTMHFETSGDKVDRMKLALYKELNDLLRDGVTAADVASIVSSQKQRLATERKDSGYWLNALYAYTDRGIDQTVADFHTSVLDSMTAEMVHRTANEFYKKACRAEVVVRSKTENKIEIEKQK